MKAVIGILMVVAILVIGLNWYSGNFEVLINKTETTQTEKSEIKTKMDAEGVQIGEPPWSAGHEKLEERLRSLGLLITEEEDVVIRQYQHLDIWIKGQAVEIPANIGIDPGGKFASPLRTYDTTGIIHVRSPKIRSYTLGELFEVWGVKFTNECVGGVCNQGSDKWRLYGNGNEASGDFGQMILRPYQELLLVYGAEGELPDPLPASYEFPSGY